MFHWESFSIRSLTCCFVYLVRFLTCFVSYLVKVLFLGYTEPGDFVFWGFVLFCFSRFFFFLLI